MDRGGPHLGPQNENSKQLATTKLQPQPQYTCTHQRQTEHKQLKQPHKSGSVTPPIEASPNEASPIEASPTVEADREYQSVFNYLSAQEYPATLSSKDEKRNFRRKCQDNFKLEDGQLKYKKKGTEQWRLFIARKDDKLRILRSCHSSPLGKSRY